MRKLICRLLGHSLPFFYFGVPVRCDRCRQEVI